MPFYEYECPHCHRQTEVMQKISDRPLRKCPACGKLGLRKLISAPVFRLKGSGWYETDFKSDKEGKRNLAGGDDAPAAKDEAKADSKADSKGDGKGDGKAEAKAEAKAEPKGEGKGEGKGAAKAENKGAAAPRHTQRRHKAVAKPTPARKPKPVVRRGGKR